MELDALSNHSTSPQQRRHAHLMLAAALSAASAAAWILFRFPPSAAHVYWVCPIHEYTGLLCPGCGGTHAVASLLHGHLAEAFHANACVVVALPLLAIYVAVIYRRALTGTAPAIPAASTLTVCAGFTTTLIFTIARNVV